MSRVGHLGQGDLADGFQVARLNEPIVLVGFPYSGVARLLTLVQEVTGAEWITADLVASCNQLASDWEEVEDRGDSFSRIAQTSIRTLFNTMVMTKLAFSGATRYSLIANANPARYAALYPRAKFLCLHRAPLDVIYSAVAANPWGLAGGPCGQFAHRYPGNSVAVGADFWVRKSEQMLDFERSHPNRSLRIRYEDLHADPARTAEAIASFTGETREPRRGQFPSLVDDAPDGALSATPVGCGNNVPASRLPAHLLADVNRLVQELGYQHLPQT